MNFILLLLLIMVVLSVVVFVNGVVFEISEFLVVELFGKLV